MTAIYFKELKSCFSGMLGYLLEGFMLLIGGLYFTSIGLQQGYGEFGYILYSTNFILLIVIPLLTMRAFAEERRTKTEQLLLTAPVTIPQIVLGKYCSVVTLVAFPVLVYSLYPLILRTGGGFSLAAAYSCLMCYFLMACACIAVGIFLSNLVENQIMAALLTFCVLLVSYLMGSIQQMFTAGNLLSLVVLAAVVLAAALLVGINCRSLTAGCAVFCGGAILLAILYKVQSAALISLLTSLLGTLALFQPFVVFVSGMFSVKAIVYYLSVIGFFLFLTGKSIEKRRWN